MDLSEKDILRDVTLEGTGYRLVTWEPEGEPRFPTGQRKIGYAFFAPGETEPIFTGEDCGVSPFHAIDSDDALRGLLGFLTLRKGDTDSEYFDGYTERQIAFRDGPDCEYLSLWGMEPQADDENEPMGFIDNEAGHG